MAKPYGLANQKLSYISICKTWRKIQRMFLRMFGEYEPRRWLVRSSARPIFFPRIDDSHCDRIHSSLTAVRCFDNDYVGMQPVAWKEYQCGKYCLKELHESMDRCIGRGDITEIPLRTALNTIQSTNNDKQPCFVYLHSTELRLQHYFDYISVL